MRPLDMVYTVQMYITVVATSRAAKRTQLHSDNLNGTRPLQRHMHDDTERDVKEIGYFGMN
jgi:hypothetical protein